MTATLAVGTWLSVFESHGGILSSSSKLPFLTSCWLDGNSHRLHNSRLAHDLNYALGSLIYILHWYSHSLWDNHVWSLRDNWLSQDILGDRLNNRLWAVDNHSLGLCRCWRWLNEWFRLYWELLRSVAVEALTNAIISEQSPVKTIQRLIRLALHPGESDAAVGIWAAGVIQQAWTARHDWSNKLCTSGN